MKVNLSNKELEIIECMAKEWAESEDQRLYGNLSIQCVYNLCDKLGIKIPDCPDLSERTPLPDMEGMTDFISKTFGSLGVDKVAFVDENGNEDFSIDTSKDNTSKIVKFPKKGK